MALSLSEFPQLPHLWRDFQYLAWWEALWRVQHNWPPMWKPMDVKDEVHVFDSSVD